MADRKSFSRQVDAWISIVTHREDFVIQKLLFVGLRSLTKLTPVDTRRAKSSWRFGTDRIDKSVDRRPLRGAQNFRAASDAGNRVLREQFDKIRDAEMGHVHWLTNDLDYILALEDGHSPKGRAMLRATFGVLLAALPAIVARARTQRVFGKDARRRGAGVARFPRGRSGRSLDGGIQPSGEI